MKDFEINESTSIKGVYIIVPSKSTDDRGTIWTTFIENNLGPLLPKDVSFVHDKFSSSVQDTLRGIHGDSKSWKLVTCVYGEIFQVVVDLRQESETFNRHQAFNLDYKQPKLILIPPSMGNAFYVKSKTAIYHYKLAYNGDYIDANEQFSVKWNDPNLNIKWPSDNPILSGRDK